LPLYRKALHRAPRQCPWMSMDGEAGYYQAIMIRGLLLLGRGEAR
jgi:hypothetical protein